MNNPVIVSFARTPIGKFGKSLSSIPAPVLGSIAVKGALSRTGIKDDICITEAFMGNVLSAGIGQAPCRQAIIGAGISTSAICTTINKVCASGMKSTILASHMIKCGVMSPKDAIIAGGFESMSNVPHYLMASRAGIPLGDSELVDGLVHDGLWDAYNNQHMGMCAEKCARDFNIDREEQDAYAIESYTRAQRGQKSGVFSAEIEEVYVPQKKGDAILVDVDEELSSASINVERIQSLRPAFDRENGTVTAANASSLNDGAAAMVLMSERNAQDLGLRPLARILGSGEAAQDPVDFTTSPSLAIKLASKNSGVDLSNIEYHEINEAFSVVALANMKLLHLDPQHVNAFGGAVALGHPIGCSGARIIGNLYNVLKHYDASIGCASICNGGGGASAIILERMS